MHRCIPSTGTKLFCFLISVSIFCSTLVLQIRMITTFSVQKSVRRAIYQNWNLPTQVYMIKIEIPGLSSRQEQNLAFEKIITLERIEQKYPVWRQIHTDAKCNRMRTWCIYIKSPDGNTQIYSDVKLKYELFIQLSEWIRTKGNFNPKDDPINNLK